MKVKKFLIVAYVAFVVLFVLTLGLYRSQDHSSAPTEEQARTLYWGMSCDAPIIEYEDGFRCEGYVIPSHSVFLIYGSVLFIATAPVAYALYGFTNRRR